MRNLWFLLRLLFVAYWAYVGWQGMLQGSEKPQFPLATIHLPLAALVGALATRFWVARAYFDSKRAEPSYVPSWYDNPVQPSQPFQAMHVGGVAFAAMGLFAILRGPRSSDEAASTSLPTELFAAAFGVGILLGIYWTLHSYPGHFTRRRGDA